MIYCNMSEALLAWHLPQKCGGPYSEYDALERKAEDDARKVVAHIKRVFKSNRAQCYSVGFASVVVFGKGAKSIAQYYLRERYLDGDVDILLAPVRIGNAYQIRLF